MAKACYICGEKATSVEHVPPIGFFPKGMRMNLLTVPSCHQHNSAKSHDDEYVRLVVTSLISSGEVSRHEIWPKIKRSFQYEPSKVKVFKNLQPIVLGSIQTGMFEPDMERFQNGIKAIVSGLYFAMYKAILQSDIQVLSPGTGFLERDSPVANRNRGIVEQGFLKFLGALPKFGSNPQVFYFQYFGDSLGGIMCLTFYEGVRIIVALGSEELDALGQRLIKLSELNIEDLEVINSAVEVQLKILRLYPIDSRVGRTEIPDLES